MVIHLSFSLAVVQCLVLTIFRNILHVPDRHVGNHRETLHDRAVLAFHESGITDLMINLANHIGMYENCAILVMEIVAQLIREQTPLTLLVGTHVLSERNG